MPNLRDHFKDGVLWACDAVCGKKRVKRAKGDTWWWNEEVMQTISKRNNAHKVMCRNCTDEN